MKGIDVLLLPCSYSPSYLPPWAEEFTLRRLIAEGFSDFITPRGCEKAEGLIREAGCNIQTVNLEKDCPLGDILRELKARNMVEGELLLLPLGIVIDLQFRQLVEEHQHRNKADPDSILTMVLTKSNARTGATYLVGADNGLMQVARVALHQSFHIQFGRFTSKTLRGARLRNDLADTGVAVLSHQVLKSFRQNFQFYSLQDFNHYILTSDVNVEKVHVKDIRTYFNPLSCPRDQLQLRLDLLAQRFSPQPPTPASKLFIQARSPSHCGNIGPWAYIGQNCIVGRKAQAIKSIVLDGCQLKEGTILFECIVQPGTVVSGQYRQKIIGDQILPLHPLGQTVVHPSLFDEGPKIEQQADQLIQLLEDVLSTPREQRKDKGFQINAYVKSSAKPIDPVLRFVIAQLTEKSLGAFTQWAQSWGQFLGELISDEVRFIEKLVECWKEQKEEGLHVVIQLLYKEDVLTREGILAWKCADQSLQQKLQKFILFLQEMEEEDEEGC